MPRNIRLINEFSFDAATYYRALTRRDYWEARALALGGPSAELDFRREEPGFAATLLKPVAPGQMPPRLAAIWPSGLWLTYCEHWSPPADGVARAVVGGRIPAVGNLTGHIEIRDLPDGCVSECYLTVSSRLPLSERLIVSTFAKGIAADCGVVNAFTVRWVEHRAVG